jgi:Sulfatase
MHKLKNILGQKPVYLLLLPLFFVLHGYTTHFPYIKLSDALLLFLKYAAFALVIGAIAYLFYRRLRKAALLSFIILFIEFFGGQLHQWLSGWMPGLFLLRHTYFIPLLLLLLAGSAFLIARSKPTAKGALFLNTALLLFIGMDAAQVGWKAYTRPWQKNSQENSAQLTDCHGCAKNDIYLIIVDEYAGKKTLQDIFHFTNTPFEDSLRSLGFQVAQNSFSNYKFTPFSMASFFNMNYLPLKKEDAGEDNFRVVFKYLYHNPLIPFLEKSGYTIYNNSIFPFKGYPHHIRQSFIPYGENIILYHTLHRKLLRELGFHLTRFNFYKKEYERIIYEPRELNEQLLKETTALAATPSDKPKFVYTHLFLPHYPYFFNSRGQAYPFETLLEGEQKNGEHYTEYLQYSNARILNLIKTIRQQSTRPPVILLLSDHGFRFHKENTAPAYTFYNLNAIYLPSGNYTGFYDSISNVNTIRIFLNNELGQKLPLLKDTSYLLSH